MDDLASEVERLRAARVHFRNDIVTGPGGSQILLEDPSGNPVELFKMGFAEPRALTQTVQGYALALVEYRRPIL